MSDDLIDGCPDCGRDTVVLDDPSDENTARCSHPRCGWRA